ncbi:hypothetical protein BGZ47_006022 [Haplosporangium gracile]|nr:hypothetical protein BGZ47_006022 [Haplosporangium gracile]
MRRLQWDIDDDGNEPHSRSLHCYKRLARSNPRLEDLLWNGKFSGKKTILDLEDFAGLVQLEFLMLINWDGSGGRLTGILRAIASTLTKLTLKHVVGYKDGVFISTGHDGSSEDTEGNKNAGNANRGRGSGQEAVVTTTLCMPVLRDLVLGNTESVEWLVSCCPSLELLDVKKHDEEHEKELDFVRIARGIQEISRCRTLRNLYVSYILASRDVLRLIESCPPSKPGLQHLSLNLQGLEVDVVSGILLHSPASKILNLSIQRCRTSCSLRVLQLLSGCLQHLETLSLTIYVNYGNDLVAA